MGSQAEWPDSRTATEPGSVQAANQPGRSGTESTWPSLGFLVTGGRSGGEGRAFTAARSGATAWGSSLGEGALWK